MRSEVNPESYLSNFLGSGQIELPFFYEIL